MPCDHVSLFDFLLIYLIVFACGHADEVIIPHVEMLLQLLLFDSPVPPRISCPSMYQARPEQR